MIRAMKKEEMAREQRERGKYIYIFTMEQQQQQKEKKHNKQETDYNKILVGALQSDIEENNTRDRTKLS